MQDGANTYEQLLAELEKLRTQVAELERQRAEIKQSEKKLQARIAALTRPVDDIEKVTFEDLFNLVDLQRLQDLLADVWGVASIITHPDGSPITQPSNFTVFCSEFIRPNPRGLRNCEQSDATIGRHDSSGPIIQPCLSAGLCNAGASITVGNRHIANWLIGQVRNETQTEEQIIKYARELGVDETRFVEAFYKVPFMSQAKFGQIAHVLFAVANQLSTTAYQNLLQGRFIAERKLKEEQLRRAHSELEVRVEERTSELSSVNATLSAEIAERKQAEEALRRSREDYRQLFENAVVAIHRTTEDGRFLSANPMAARLLGYDSPEELISSITDIAAQIYVHPEDRAKAVRLMREEGFIRDFEVRCRRKDGKVGWGSLSAQVVRNEQGQVLYFEGTGLDITERKRMEQQLRESEERHKNLVTLSRDGIFETNDQGILTFVNEAQARILGYRHPEELVGKSIFKLVVHQDRENLIRVFLDAASRGEVSKTVELTAVRPDGGLVDIEVMPTLVTKRDGTVSSFGVVRDITERKRMLKEEREAQEKYRSIFEGAVEGIFRTSITGETVVCNPAAARILGYDTPEEALEAIAGLKRRVWVDQRQRVEYLQRLEEENNIRGFESRFYRRDKTKIWLSLDSRAIRGTDGRITFIETFFQDITKRKRDAEILSARVRLMEYATSHSLEELLQKTIDEVEAITESSIGFYHFVESDQSTIRLQTWSGRTLKEFCQAEGRGLHYSLDSAGVWADCIREHHALVHNDYSALPNRKGMPEGHAHVARELVVPVFRGDLIVAVLGVGNKPTDYDESDVSIVSQFADLAWDIVEHKRAQEQILRLNYQNALILGAVMEGIIGTDRDGSITFVNPSGAQKLGYGVEELMGKGLHQTVHHSRFDGSEYPIADCPMDQTLRGGQAISVRDEVLWRKDGTNFPVSYTCAPIFESGQIVGTVVGFRDITEIKLASERETELKAQLHHIQKMEAIGTMAGGIAHDFNNILSPILGYTEMALDEAGESGMLRQCLEQVLMAGLRAKDLVGQILAFSRRGEQRAKRPVEISAIVKEALKLLRASLPSTIEITQHLEKGMIEADATQIHQVIVNLCTNAAHAMEDRGKLDVSLTNVELEPSDLSSWFALASLRPGPHVRLRVSDTGHGMNEETLRRIFEPYFTTKDLGKGTGLGLSVVHGIIKNHGGEITVRSTLGQGSIFDVYLPLLAIESSQLLVESKPLPTGSERLLIVDDEEAIARMTATILERLGYRVTTRMSSREAFDLFRSDPEAFDLIITDYTMPAMTGTELAQEIHRVRPALPVILCTGFSEKVAETTAEQLGISGIAMKPVSRRELAELVRSVLDSDSKKKGRST